MKARNVIQGANYGPSELKILSHAYEAAWVEVGQNLSGAFGGVETARLNLAHAILSAARHGSMDAERIKADALRIMYTPPVEIGRAREKVDS